MKRLKNLLRQQEFSILLVLISVFLFSYPLLVMSNANSMDTVYLVLFIPWLFVIILYFAMGNSYSADETNQKTTTDENKEVNDV